MGADNSDPWLPSLSSGLWAMAEALNQRRIRYALIGGLAINFRGRFRFTADIDFLLDIPQLVLPGLLDDLQASGFILDQPTIIREWVQDHLTSLNFENIIIDWLKPVIPCFQHILDSASPVEWHGKSLRIATAEGLIVMKLLSFRPRDQNDIETLLAANQGMLDLDVVRREWATVGELSDPQMVWFEEMVRQFYVNSKE